MITSLLYNLAEICAQQGLKHMVLSPGSRVAPLTLAFARHPLIQSLSLSDERSAAFTALGMAGQRLAQYEQSPGTSLLLVGLACTSGSAAYNYAPAISEAFYQQIPLLIFTADRPPEWIDQADGQTIRQRHIYGSHIKADFELPVDYNHPDAVWHAERIMNEALYLAQTPPRGPVHINVPIREPFYPSPDEKMRPRASLKNVQVLPSQAVLEKSAWNLLLDEWDDSDRKLIVAGQSFVSPSLQENLRLLSQDFKIPIVGDVISNLSGLPGLIDGQDTFLLTENEAEWEELRPDLLITFGKSILSKSLKLYLRKFSGRYEHWHIQPAGPIADPFQSLTRMIPLEAEYFFKQLYSDLDFSHMLEHDEDGLDNPYYLLWQKAQQQVDKHRSRYAFPPEKLSELQAVQEVLRALPPGLVLHVANSMPVRYVNFLGLENNFTETFSQTDSPAPLVFANRGTSGIDGCLSTAVGSAMVETTRLVTVLIGDIAFFYDRNGLWNNHLPSNLRIVLLNNRGGNIFRMIAGPRQQPELEEYFETYQKLSAENTARDFDLIYHAVEDLKTLRQVLLSFFQPSEKSQILEIHTDKQWNFQVFEDYKRHYRQENSKVG